MLISRDQGEFIQTVVHSHNYTVLTELTQLLKEPGKLPGCSGSRNLHNNISDLRAQVAANQKVII